MGLRSTDVKYFVVDVEPRVGSIEFSTKIVFFFENAIHHFQEFHGLERM